MSEAVQKESPPCECPAAGFCRRFGRNMIVAQHQACQTNSGGYRDHHTAIAEGRPSPVTGNPPPPPPPPPALWRKAANFASAVLAQAPLIAKALLTGDEAQAFRSPEEIEEIAEICRGCSLFNGEVCTHKNCGCQISADRNVWLSKLAWRSQTCPDDPPRWGRDEEAPKASLLPVVAKTPTVSIIVTARNYGRFLDECLRSCVAQTERAVDVIYSDDASEDDSLAVAQRVEGVKVIEHHLHSGVCAARNDGVAASRGEVLIHVDGDDRLPPNFVAKHLAALKPESPFAYGPAQAFGMHDTLWGVPQWGQLPLWERNFVNTSAAYWRRIFDAAGGWQETCLLTMWDWSLAIRASRFGRPVPSDATLQYRQHGESWSHSHSIEKTGRIGEQLGPGRRELARISIGCIYSGRVAELLPRWLDALVENIAEAQLATSPDLVLLDNAGAGDLLRREIERRASSFAAVRVLPHPWAWQWANEDERRREVSAYMAAASNRLLAETSGDVLWFVEDDVLPPPHALRDLFGVLTDGLPIKGAAAAPYKNRHAPERFVGGYWRDYAPHEFTELPDEPVKVDLAGTGCTLFWRWAAAQPFSPFYRGHIAAHDWEFSRQVAELGRDVMLVPSARCRHYRTGSEWV